MFKFLTCGSVDDGKSTLIGRMLYDAKLLYEDHLLKLREDSKDDLDFSLITDGLTAEREQGITIDVAYRYFSTKRRTFIVADTPGHEQYTKNMAVGASFADLAIILVDVIKGITEQTIRHMDICELMGIRHFVIALNKMDLVGYNREYFENIKYAIEGIAKGQTVYIVPLSAKLGDNVTQKSLNMPWFDGIPLLTYLEEITITNGDDRDFSMPVQIVVKGEERGFQGQVEHGVINVGDRVKVLPSKESVDIKAIISGFDYIDKAVKGDAITLFTQKEVDISRGDVLTKCEETFVADMFRAKVLWMDESPLIVGRSYYLKLATKTVSASVIKISKIENHSSTCLNKNEFAICEIVLSEQIAFELFSSSKVLGSFILIDKISKATSAWGRIEEPIRRAGNVVWEELDVTKEIRARQKAQKPITIWFTGLSCSGKSTLANALEKKLVAQGKHTMLLDGDNLRHGINKDLGFSEPDRVENIRRVAEVAKLMNDAGLIVLASFISPYERDRQNAREIIGESFFEVYVSTPLSVCESRDKKGLYKKAREGKICDFTGIQSSYEPPISPDMVIDTSDANLDEFIERICNIISL